MTVGVHKFGRVALVQEVHKLGCWASDQLSLLGDRISCSASPELCTTVERREDGTAAVIRHSDLSPHNSVLDSAKSCRNTKAKAKLRRLLESRWLEPNAKKVSNYELLMACENLHK